MVFALPLSYTLKSFHITQLEMLNVIVVLKVWANNWANKKLEIKCDHLAIV